MTPAEFKAARHTLGLTQAELGAILDTAPQTIRKWEMDGDRSTARAPNPIACQVLRWMLAGFDPAQYSQYTDQPDIGEPFTPRAGRP